MNLTNLPTYHGIPIEPERYEFYEDPTLFDIDRRDFFRIVGAGLVVALVLGDEVQAQQPGRGGQRGGGRGGAGPAEIGAWLHIGEDSTVTAFTGKVEIGQNARTSLTQAVAEELHTPVTQIKMVMADTALVPPDGGTFGSQTTPQMNSRLRRVAAAAREVLLDMAAEQEKIDRKALSVKDGKVVGPNGQSFAFGRLTKGQKLMKAVSNQTPLAPANEWKVAGTSVPKVDGRAIVTGTHQYASDIRRPGMLFGKVLRPTSYKAKLVSVDTKEAEALPGVKVVHQGDFVAAVAPTEYAAATAIEAMKAEWQATKMPSSDEIFKYLKDHPGGRGGRGGGGGGRGGGAAPGNPAAIAEGLKAADHTVKSTYTIAYIAHIALEPRVAVAEWADGKMTVWTGTQGPFRVRDQVASALGLSSENVRLIVPDMGSGYGGKHTNMAAVEAARLAKAVGQPVKVAWTREEEFGGGYFRPSGVIEVTAGVKKDGTLTAWEFHNYNSGASAIATPYDVPGPLTQFHGTDYPLEQGSYRGLAATANTFAREAAMDDLAHVIGMDPLQFRLENLKNPRNQHAARLSAVFRAAAEKFGWGKTKPAANRGFGIGGGTEKGSYVATCAEVSVDPRNGRVKVIRAVTAFECGAIVNPDHLKNQVEGAVVMGLGGALFEHMEFDHDKLLNPRLADYRVPRFQDIPVLETVLVNRKDLPSAGAGETPIVGIAPALRNAIAQAAGVRLCSMPLAPEGVKKT